MKQNSFILIEALICITLLVVCVIPIFGYPFFHFHQQKNYLLNIEKQRQAELIFYEVFKDIQNTHTWDEIEKKYARKTNRKKLKLEINGLGVVSFDTHIHLYHCHKEKSDNNRKIWLGVCFKENCKYKKGKENPYQFVFFARKNVEKKEDKN